MQLSARCTRWLLHLHTKKVLNRNRTENVAAKDKTNVKLGIIAIISFLHKFFLVVRTTFLVILFFVSFGISKQWWPFVSVGLNLLESSNELKVYFKLLVCALCFHFPELFCTLETISIWLN